MKTVSTFTATIYVGFREQYTGIVRDITMAKEFLHAKADMGGLCVTITPLLLHLQRWLRARLRNRSD